MGHRRPRVWIGGVDRLHESPAGHGDETLRSAFERGVAEGLLGHEDVAHFLREGGTPSAPPATQMELG